MHFYALHLRVVEFYRMQQKTKAQGFYHGLLRGEKNFS